MAANADVGDVERSEAWDHDAVEASMAAMPLVVFCGLPAAGKSYVATRLVEYLREHVQSDVVYITEATVNVNRLEGYKNGHIEKISRGALRAATEQALNSKTIVVLDALNYIKGSRYEFFCKARAESTTYCVVYVDTPVELALERNSQLDEPYEPELYRDGGIADRLVVPKASAELHLYRSMTAAEVRRHRRQFIKITQMVPCPVSELGDRFVEYLNQQA
ncbi:hypothetical protein ATCC90586_006881 [Pythium insidiosum]|nr:hypothetical protein ATCC90586_006881 [Pythium insidiosum]